MECKDAINEIKRILGEEIIFEGHFALCFDNLKETQQQTLLEWLQKCKDHEIGPIQSKHNRELIGFVERFGSNVRAILTKERIFYCFVS